MTIYIDPALIVITFLILGIIWSIGFFGGYFVGLAKRANPQRVNVPELYSEMVDIARSQVDKDIAGTPALLKPSFEERLKMQDKYTEVMVKFYMVAKKL